MLVVAAAFTFINAAISETELKWPQNLGHSFVNGAQIFFPVLLINVYKRLPKLQESISEMLSNKLSEWYYNTDKGGQGSSGQDSKQQVKTPNEVEKLLSPGNEGLEAPPRPQDA
jgi:hypothetical protein